MVVRRFSGHKNLPDVTAALPGATSGCQGTRPGRVRRTRRSGWAFALLPYGHTEDSHHGDGQVGFPLDAFVPSKWPSSSLTYDKVEPRRPAGSCHCSQRNVQFGWSGWGGFSLIIGHVALRPESRGCGGHVVGHFTEAGAGPRRGSGC
jgi:hypothetical protein